MNRISRIAGLGIAQAPEIGAVESPLVSTSSALLVIRHLGKHCRRYVRTQSCRCRGTGCVCVDPPDHAVVIPVAGKTRVQAPGRTRKPLPMKSGHPGTRTRDCRRCGTTCLLAALDIAIGRVAGSMIERHRPEDFRAFLDHVADGTVPGTKVRAILDNVSARKSAEVHEWLKRHPDRTFHFTPTSASRASAIEGFSSNLSRQRLGNAVFNSVDECIAAVEDCIEHHDANDARPFRWSGKPGDLVEAWKKEHQKQQE